jgi:hypothetical protein
MENELGLTDVCTLETILRSRSCHTDLKSETLFLSTVSGLDVCLTSANAERSVQSFQIT